MAIGFSWNTWLGAREPQSMAFLSAALSEKLYSGLAISSPSAAATSARKRFADSGNPASNTSWLNSGRSSRRAYDVIFMPAGIRSAQISSAAVLKDPLRRLPLMPSILSSATRCLPILESGEFTSASARAGGAGPDSADDGGAAGHAGARGCAARAHPVRLRARADDERHACARARAWSPRAHARAHDAP